VSAIALMPLFGWAKLRLGEQLESGATAGEGIRNIMIAHIVSSTRPRSVSGFFAFGLGFWHPIGSEMRAEPCRKR
jgi:hypothetical protein